MLADFKILENLNFEIPASLILTKFSRFYRSTMTSQVFCQKFPNENLAERLARSAHNLKVLGSIPSWEFFKSFFLLKFSFFQNNFMFCAILNKKYHCKCFLSSKNGNWCQKRTFQNVKFSKILKSASTNLLQVATSNSFAMSSGGPKEHLCEFFWSCDDFYFQESKITPPIQYVSIAHGAAKLQLIKSGVIVFM